MAEPPLHDLGPGPNSEDFDPKQHIWDGREWWTQDRSHWWDGAQWQPRDAPHVSGLAQMAGAATDQQAALTPVNPAHRRDFWIGFSLWFVVNTAFVVGVQLFASALNPTANGLLLLANILVLGVMAFVRSFVALGMVTAFAAAFVLTIFEGCFFTLSDFAGGLYDTSTLTGFLVVGAIVFGIVAFFPLRAIHRRIR